MSCSGSSTNSIYHEYADNDDCSFAHIKYIYFVLFFVSILAPRSAGVCVCARHTHATLDICNTVICRYSWLYYIFSYKLILSNFFCLPFATCKLLRKEKMEWFLVGVSGFFRAHSRFGQIPFLCEPKLFGISAEGHTRDDWASWIWYEEPFVLKPNGNGWW